MNLKNKKIIVCVSGGIAAYKACEFVRELIKSGAEVRVAMTKSATKFVTPLTLETLSNHEVSHEMFPNSFISTRHIDWADWADLMVFIPATANTIAKLAHGFSDDIITTITLAFRGPKLIAPAMNTNMWHNSIVQANIESLKKHGFVIMGTSVGDLACGWVGEGRLAELQHIVEFVYYSLADKIFSDKKIVINAGPTIENLDPVRYISNYSSGKMGYALARAAWALGADVTLITGKTHITGPFEINTIQVKTADEMFDASINEFKSADIFIGAAAVVDYKPSTVSDQKIKKKDDKLSIELSKNRDILQVLGKQKKNQIIVGFALETNNAVENATKKMKSKNLDMIILNETNAMNYAFEADHNSISMISEENDTVDIKNKSKSELAYDILQELSIYVK